MSITVQELITKVQVRLSLVAGLHAQLYAEDKIASLIEDTFNMAFVDDFWPDYMKWMAFSVDGTTGLPTTKLNDADESDRITEFKHIRKVFKQDQEQSMSVLPTTINPYLLTGTSAKYFENYTATDAERILRMWPLTTTDTFYVNYRQHPGTFNSDTVLYMDELLLLRGTMWLYLIQQGGNPGGAQENKLLFLDRQEVCRAQNALNDTATPNTQDRQALTSWEPLY